MVSGSTIRPMVKVLSSTRLEIPILEPGSTKKQMDLEYTRPLMALSIEVSGRMTFSMVMALKRCRMGQTTRVTLEMVQKMGMVNTATQTVQYTRDNGQTTKLAVLERKFGHLVKLIMDNGTTIKWKV